MEGGGHEQLSRFRTIRIVTSGGLERSREQAESTNAGLLEGGANVQAGTAASRERLDGLWLCEAKSTGLIEMLGLSG